MLDIKVRKVPSIAIRRAIPRIVKVLRLYEREDMHPKDIGAALEPPVSESMVRKLIAKGYWYRREGWL